jgi:hypothetical protein
VFVSGGHRRSRAVRVAVGALGVLLAGWLLALVAGLVGFTPLPELALPGTGAARTAPASPDHIVARGAHPDGRAHASTLARLAASGGGEVSSATGSEAPSATGRDEAAAGTGLSDPLSTSPRPGGGTQPRPTTPPDGTPAQATPGEPPAFTPPASGQKSAHPPRGNSANAPGKLVSADPPGKATRTRSG